MEWEEALLRAQGGQMEPQASYYRRQASRSRHMAEGVTTQAGKARLLDEAVRYEALADAAERATP